MIRQDLKRVFVPVEIGTGLPEAEFLALMDRVHTVFGDMGFTAIVYYRRFGDQQYYYDHWRTGKLLDAGIGGRLPSEAAGSKVARFELDVPDEMALPWVRALVRHALHDAGLNVEPGEPLTRG